MKNNNREVCGGCLKQIYTHNKIIVCNTCSLISHFECSEKATFKLFQSATLASPAVWHCSNCSEQYGMLRYNPYLEVLSSQDGEDTEWGECADLYKMSDILENCKMFKTANEFNGEFRRTLKNDKGSPFSVFFNNVDGNFTNFDNLSVEIKKITHKISAIALCETNIDATHKSLYNLEGYDSIYQSKLPNKLKGSGLGL